VDCVFGVLMAFRGVATLIKYACQTWRSSHKRKIVTGLDKMVILMSALETSQMRFSSSALSDTEVIHQSTDVLGCMTPPPISSFLEITVRASEAVTVGGGGT
jgi:hypothetical protein